MTRWQGTLLLAVLFGACAGDGDQASTVSLTVDTIDGVVHVRNSGRAPSWPVEPVLQLGSVTGGPEEFGRIRSLVADPAGNIYVAEASAQEIRVFTSEGRHLRTIGRRGAGPAEFNDLYSLAWLEEKLVAMDPRNARLSILTTTGEWIEQIQHFPITGPASLIRLHPLGTEGFYTPIVSAQRGGLPWVRHTPAGASDTIISPQRPEGIQPSGITCFRSDGGITSITLPQSPRLVYAFPPPGGTVAVSWTESYRIVFVRPGGDTLRIVVREGPALPYPDSLWHEGLRPYTQMMEDFPGTGCEPAAPQRPRNRAALRSIVFDDEGSMWVEAASENGFVWDVFDSEGRLLGTAPAPDRVETIPVYVRGGHLYQVEAGELDVPVVGVYRLR